MDFPHPQLALLLILVAYFTQGLLAWSTCDCRTCPLIGKIGQGNIKRCISKFLGCQMYCYMPFCICKGSLTSPWWSTKIVTLIACSVEWVSKVLRGFHNLKLKRTFTIYPGRNISLFGNNIPKPKGLPVACGWTYLWLSLHPCIHLAIVTEVYSQIGILLLLKPERPTRYRASFFMVESAWCNNLIFSLKGMIWHVSAHWILKKSWIGMILNLHSFYFTLSGGHVSS